MADNQPSWPAATVETLDWASNIAGLSGRQRARILPTYQATITPAIADVESIEISGRTAADLAEAEATIERFDASVGASLSGFAVIALRTEAVASSRIENLSASATSIALAEHLPKTQRGNSNAEAIYANVETLRHALERDTAIDADEIIEIQRVLLEQHAPQLTGKFRDEQVWIGGSNYSPHGAEHVAPHHHRVPAAINDWSAFAQRQDLGRLAHIAVAHAQLETIHPFPDGNGRTGRVIVQRMLRRSGLTTETILPISAGLLTNIDQYFAGLNDYRRGLIEPIISAFTSATFATAANAQQLADELTKIREVWNERVTARSDSAVWLVLDQALKSPVISSTSIAADLAMTPHRARAAIGQLKDAGILHTNSKARRNQVWLVTEVIAAIEAFTGRARRQRTG